ncbi:MAG: HD domain-containing protein [Firmicutes bacterium]|nr:HD domain-containing protein [Bacillota bacterium]
MAFFIRELSKFFNDELGYSIAPESIQKDHIRFKIKRCPFAEGKSPSLCSIMQGIVGGLGFLFFGYSKIIQVSGPEQAPNPCCVDLYFSPSPELEKKVGLEYSKSAISLLKGEDYKFIDSQRQMRRKIILGLFSSLAYSINEKPSPKKLANKYIESLSCIPEIRLAALYLKNNESGNFNLEAQYGFPADILPLISAVTRESIGASNNDEILMAAIEDFNGHRSDIAKRLSVRSFASVRIKPHNETIGVLTIGWKSTFPVSPETREAIRASCTMLGTAIDNSRLYFELETAFVNNISVLNNLVNTIDQFSNDHSKRVAELARSIAAEMDLSEDDIILAYDAGLIHDIGKIKVPAEILNKSEPLTKQEFELIKEHPKTGANLITPISSLQRVVPAVLYHHERLDGSGYPEGLSGDLIPLHARIIAVADVYDAMMNKRAYRDAASEADVIQEIINESGVKYDPIVVGALMAVLNNKQISSNETLCKLETKEDKSISA